MADNDVRIKLSLDGASQVQQGLAGVGDGAGRANSGLGGLVRGGLAGAGAALAGLATAAVAAGGALTGSVISAYAAYEQNIGGIETMFGEAASTMQRYADEAYATAGLSANEYMAQATSFSASLLQGLGGDTAAAAEYANMAMIDMSDNANKFGSNISDIQNAYQGFAKDNFDMLSNLRLGYGGTASEMARLVNDAGLMEDGFVATAENINSVPFDQIIASINQVQNELGIAGTTAQEAEATISGSVGMLQASWANLLTGLGSADADVATLAGNVISSLELVVTNITPVIENIGTNVATLGPQLASLGPGLVSAISAAIPAVLSAGTSLIGGLIAGIGGALPGLITAIVPGIVGLVEMVATQAPLLLDAGLQAVTALANGIATALPTLIPMAIQMIIGLVDAIIMNLPMMMDAALQLITGLAQGLITALPILIAALPQLIIGLIEFLLMSIPQIIQAGITLLTSLITALPEIIVTIVTALPQIITGIIDALLTSIPLIIQAGFDLITALIDNLPGIIVTIVQAIPQIITGIVNALVNSIPRIVQTGWELLVSLFQNLGSAVSNLVSKIPQIINGIVGALGNGISAMVAVGGDIVAGIWSGISGATGWLLGQIGGFVDTVMGSIGDFFGIASPSKRMRDEIGDWLPAGIGVGVAEHEDDAIRPIQRMNRRIMSEAQSLAMPTAVSASLRVARQVPVAGMVATAPFATQASSQPALADSLARQLARGVGISSRDMDVMATKVARALYDIRREDGRETMMAIKQGAL